MNNRVKDSILIVDDKPENLFALETILGALEIDIVKATSGKDALWLLIEQEFALVIIDVQMPEMDGFETAEIIRSREKTKNLPIIFATAINKEDTHIFKGYEVGAVDYLFKPINPDILKSKVNIFLELHRQKRVIKDQANELKESEEMFRAISTSAQDGIILIDNSGKISYANSSAELIFGYTQPEFEGKEFLFLLPNDYHQAIWERFKIYRETGKDEYIGKIVEFSGIRKDGKVIPIEVSLSTLILKKKQCILALVRDITKRKETEIRLNTMAHFDNLTGLPNRKLFFDSITKSIAMARRHNYLLALFFIDIDRFKEINDTFGHEKGDIYLKEVAKRMVEAVRISDMVCRVGGDEFTIILTKISNKKDVSIIAEKILESLNNNPLTIGEKELLIRASIGISIFPEDGHDIKTLLGNADAAMYHVKKRHKNNYQLYSLDLNLDKHDRLMIENQLYTALEKEEINIHYQPKINISTGKITGLEALLRWNNSVLGNIPPDKFIGIAEEIGIITRIEEWVIHTVSKQYVDWEKYIKKSIPIAVNLSGYWFKLKQHKELLKNIIKKVTAINPLLEIEITENILMEHIVETIPDLNELKRMGITFSLDDFGTGYSSMSYLKRLPISKIKIDKSFIDNLTSNIDDVAIVTAIISMSKTMNLRVIAEGVETVEQLEILKSLKCDEMQGYLFSRPIPAEEIPKLFEDCKYKFSRL